MKNFIQTFINNCKRLKKRNKIIIITIIIPIVMYFVPVKFAVKSDDIDKDKEYYILKLVYGDVTDGGWYIVDGWDNQLIGTGIYLRYVSGCIPSIIFLNQYVMGTVTAILFMVH